MYDSEPPFATAIALVLLDLSIPSGVFTNAFHDSGNSALMR